MTAAQQISPGATVNIDGKIYRIESAMKVASPKGASFMKMKLRDLITEEVTEKNIRLDQEMAEVALSERVLEFLYPEHLGYLFLDVESLDQVLVPAKILGEKIHFLKEGTEVKAMFYGESIFAIELPQFLEVMVVKTEGGEEGILGAQPSTKRALLETGARLDVPLFVESGDVIKVDTQTNEYIQRV